MFKSPFVYLRIFVAPNELEPLFYPACSGNVTIVNY